MEVYKIECLVNNKVYIGSTKYTKEIRFNDLSCSTSHLSRARDGDTRPLYEDIRKYGKENFELTTIETTEDRLSAYRREDYWLKHYWNLLGESMMYNQKDSACGNHNWSVPHDKESQRKVRESLIKRYGAANGALSTPEVMEKAKQSKLAKYGTLAPRVSSEGRESQRKKVSAKIYDSLRNDILRGYESVTHRLNEEGYNITFWVVKRMVNGVFSEATKSKYPELIDRFSRAEGMTFPNQHCGHCSRWLAYREPDTTEEQNKEIEEYCNNVCEDMYADSFV